MDDLNLSHRAALVAEAMLRRPQHWHLARNLAGEAGLPVQAASQILARFYDWGWVTDRRVPGGVREYQFTSGGDELADDALRAFRGVNAPPVTYTTVAELEDEVRRGGMSPALLAAVRRRLAGG